jgi:hypothetical protein
MQPFDDKIPEEMDANTTMIAFLGHVYARDEAEGDVESKSVDTEEMQAVVRVRERLLQLTQEQWPSVPGTHGPTSERARSGLSTLQPIKGWRQLMKGLALVAMLVLVIGSSFFITGLVQQRQLAVQSNTAATPTGGYIVRPSRSGNLLIGDMLQADQVSRFLLQNQQFTQINQSRMVNGYQVTLDRAYSDANIVLLGIYAVMPYAAQADREELKDPYFFPDGDNHIRLTTAGGVRLPSIGSSYARDMSNVRHEQKGVLLGFDGAGIQGGPARITLNLQMDVHCQGWSPNYKCLDTVNFSFTLPFHAARQITMLQQTVTQNGKTFALERAVISPAEARFYIGGWTAAMLTPTPEPQHSQQKSYDETWYNIKLSVANKTYDLCTMMTPLNCPQGARTGASVPRHPSVRFYSDTNANAVYLNNDQTIPGFSLLEPFNEHGKMTVTITKKLLHFVKDTATNNGGYVAYPDSLHDDKSAAPWVFEFTLF